MTEKELFIARLACSEELRQEFIRDPKSVLEKEGLNLEDLDGMPLRMLLCPVRPSADGTEICSTQCTETCPLGPGTKVGSVIGNIINFATPTIPSS